ncbi:hypothetical protein [Azospirillum sp. A39]|uniref:hypothetical protein n=1 Tax=Azospirillum sp. A39 TaxID=3462279 RepID=UPI004045F36C
MSPTVQAVIAPAAVAAQQTTAQTRTQTAAAPQAAGKADSGRDTKDSTQTGQQIDTQARAIHARTNRGYGHSRGSMLDVLV